MAQVSQHAISPVCCVPLTLANYNTGTRRTSLPNSPEGRNAQRFPVLIPLGHAFPPPRPEGERAKAERLLHEEGVRLSRRARRLAATDISPCIYCMRVQAQPDTRLDKPITLGIVHMSLVCLPDFIPPRPWHVRKSSWKRSCWLQKFSCQACWSVHISLNLRALCRICYSEPVLHDHILFTEIYHISLFGKLSEQPSRHPWWRFYSIKHLIYFPKELMHLLVGYTVASYSGDPQDPLDRNTSCTVALTAMVEFLESSPPDRHHGGVLPVCILVSEL
jgi:hypothetical protein